MAKKEFNKSFMHPTRRKLVNMVQTGGEYEADTKTGWTRESIEKREIGDKWEDEHHKYEQHKGFVMKTGKNSEVYEEIRNYLRETHNCKNTNCQTVKLKRVDAKLIKKSGYCLDCLSVIETEIRAKGFWEPYQNYKIWTRMLIDGKIRLEQMKEAHDDAKQVYEYLNDDGSYDQWENPQNVDEMKADMMLVIETGTREIQQLEEMRMKSFQELKDGNLEQYV